MQETHNPGISIILVDLHEEFYLDRLISSFLEKNSYYPIEFIITTRLVGKFEDIISKYSNGIVIKQIVFNEKISRVALKNRAVKEANYPYLLFMADNIKYNNDVLPLAAAQLENYEVGAVGVRLDDDPDSLPPGITPAVQHVGIKLAWNEDYQFYIPYQLCLRDAGNVKKVPNAFYPAVSGNFILLRKEDVISIGGFFEGLNNGFEDVDLCLQLFFSKRKKCLCINEVSLYREKITAVQDASAISKKAEIDNIIQFKSRFKDKIHNELDVNPDFSNFFCINNPEKKYAQISVDIIICIHNVLEDVKLCLDSVIHNTHNDFHIYLVNDGSDSETTEYLRQFVNNNEKCTLIENSKALGYTKAANIGMKASKGDYVVLLNSDTIVPQRWMDPILKCGESDPKIGILGPLSNAATYQSVPEVKTSTGDWAINELPQNVTVDEMAKNVIKLSECRYPRVPFINGFCYVIKREVINQLGYFDEKSFPLGYGEENDYSIRAADKGFSLVIVDDAYVFHGRSKSFTHEKRRHLSKEGRKALERKHSAKCLKNNISIMEEKSSLLDQFRNRISLYFDNPEEFIRPLKVLWLLWKHGGGGGGGHSVVQEAVSMKSLPNVYSEIAINFNSMEKCLDTYHDMPSDVFYFYENDEELIKHSREFDIVVATYYKTFSYLERIYRAANGSIIPAYYIQDYEPWFFEPNSNNYIEAIRTYTALPNTVLFAKTDFLCETVYDKHGVKVNKVKPSLDTSLYHYSKRKKRSVKTPVHIAAMVRPHTPRRSPENTMNLLKITKKKFGEQVKISIFGNNPDNIKFKQLTRDFEFNNLGLLKREEVADLLSESDIFIDMSTYQAFGRTAFEAMAIGCAVILPKDGGIYEFADHMHNSLIVDTKDMAEVLSAIEKLVIDNDLRNLLACKPDKITERFNLKISAWSEVDLMRKAISSKRLKRCSIKYRSISNKINDFNSGDNCINQDFDIKNDRYKDLSRQAPEAIDANRNKRILILPAAFAKKRNTMRYRVDHLKEQLVALGYQPIIMDYKTETTKIFEFLKDQSVPVILQRFSCEGNREFLEQLRLKASQIIYEIDDPLFCDESMDRERGKHVPEETEAFKMAMEFADCYIVSTRVLRDKVKKVFGKPVYIIQNCISQEVLKASQRALLNRYKKEIINIGFASGSDTHDDDFEIVVPALEQLLDKYPNVELTLAGNVSIDWRLSRFGNRVHLQKYVPYSKLPDVLANFDIQIIPLENNNFNTSKSHVRFIESAAVGCPVVASALGEQANTIIDGVTGFLVDNKFEWFDILAYTVENIDHSRWVGKQSFDFVKTYFQTYDSLLLYRVNQFIYDVLSSQFNDRISIMLVTYNKPYDVNQAIQAIIERTRTSYELFVWDNSGTKEMRTLLSNLTISNLRVIFSDYNVGKAPACNYFFNNFTYDYICGIDDDYFVPPGWDGKAIKAADAVPNLGWLSSNLTKDSSGLRGLGRLDNFDGVEIHCPSGVGGWMVFTTEESRQKIGFYQEHGLYGGIDGDYKCRARDSGLYVGYVKDIVGEHKVQRAKDLKYELFKQRIQDQMRIHGKKSEAVADKFLDFYNQKTKDLSVAIKICTSIKHNPDIWGDTHLGRSFANILKTYGYNVVIDFHENWYDRPREEIDVVLHLFGLHKYKPDPYHINILWIISHSDLLDDEFLSAYDVIFSASKPLTKRIKKKFPKLIVEFLPQCTDTSIFFPKKDLYCDFETTFIGNSRRIYRDAVKYAVNNNIDLKIWGTRWEPFIDKKYIVDQSISTEQVADIYRRSKIVLNDHWDDQKKDHIVNNRIFDVLACDTMVLSDSNSGINDIFGNLLPTYSDEKSFIKHYKYLISNKHDRNTLAAMLGSKVRNEHTFEKRAVKIKEALEHVILNYVEYKSER